MPLSPEAAALFSLAQALQEAAGIPEPAPSARVEEANDVTALYDELVREEELRQTTRTLVMQGNYALAVEEAFKCVNNLVKARSGSSKDGTSMMTEVFSTTSPLLKLNELRTQSQRDQQAGYGLLLGGCMLGVRNPRAHEHRYLDEPIVALELLCLANHAYRTAASAKRARRRRK